MCTQRPWCHRPVGEREHRINGVVTLGLEDQLAFASAYIHGIDSGHVTARLVGTNRCEVRLLRVEEAQQREAVAAVSALAADFLPVVLW